MTDTYNTILFEAKSLFVKQGYTATSMRQIAAAVGIGKATIYHHFPDKEAILMTLVNGNIASMRSSLMAVKDEEDPRKRFQVAAMETLRFLYETADLMQIARREVPGARELIVSNFITFYGQYSELLKESLAKGVAMNIFRPLDPEDASKVFMTMIQGSFALVYLTGLRVETPEKVSARLLDIFFHGIEVMPASRKE